MSVRNLTAMAVLVIGVTASVSAADIETVDAVEKPALDEHVEQSEFTLLVTHGDRREAYETAFVVGEELFEVPFNILDGGGANVGKGERYTRTPRADLNGPEEWANHFPSRATGPNAQACNECHASPDDAGGPASANVTRDPGHTANLARFINRNTPHLFGLGALQRLAEEMNVALVSTRTEAVAEARSTGRDVRKPLVAKGVKFGFITAHPDGTVSSSEIRGVDPSLVVKPFQWKGTVAFVRDFGRGAAHNELGMQAVELVGDDRDGDFDGVVNELTIGDQTALTIYNAAQPRPTTKSELARRGLIPGLSSAESQRISNGSEGFDRAACSSCHVRALTIQNPVFSEPSQNPNYRDAVFPGGQDPVAEGVDPRTPITFDLTRDQPDNQLTDEDGNVVYRLGAFERDQRGRAIVRLFGDLKRHEMGAGLREAIDEEGTGASMFLTKNLWGVASTPPYMHDGRATTLTEAILAHGGEAQVSKSAFLALSTRDQRDLVTFLKNLVLYKVEVEDANGVSGVAPTRPRKRRQPQDEVVSLP